MSGCDWCDAVLHRDSNGYWVGDDDTSECPSHDEGHTVDNRSR